MREKHTDVAAVVAAPGARPLPIGIITHQDVARVRQEQEDDSDLQGLRVIDVLSRDPLILSPESSITSAIRRLRERGGRYASVVDSGGTLCGIVALSDLLRHAAPPDCASLDGD